MEINEWELRNKGKTIDIAENASIGYNLENEMFSLFGRNVLIIFCEFKELKQLIMYSNFLFNRNDVVIDKELD